MRRTIIKCDICKTEDSRKWKEIFFPTPLAGGSAMEGWHEVCWDCYEKICGDIHKVYTKWNKIRKEIE